jgi:hypothetical protein
MIKENGREAVLGEWVNLAVHERVSCFFFRTSI